ncbi:Kinase, CAMK CAMKL [Spironucleus salmonicida]|uniref:Kinase, CAMK CAMKL n=1 Tax=Spironucleus salmonicida TaxID=348837 RepID=V6LRM1_9EUKA|nr:Kinase, CAMK CAMKL [Spironucleus salmonicida]|eukprot:EST43434.1 Kinase, CAMK CAMKL [Spironucleus salmonicida]
MSDGSSDSSSTVKVRVKRVSNYITGQTIAKSRFGEIKQAVHMTNGTKVCMKIIEKAKFESIDFKLLVRKLQVLKLVQHPSIVKVIDIIDTPRHIYVISEFIDGNDLFTCLMRQKQFSIPQVFAQITSAIQYAHSRKIAHRDLKLESILLDNQNNVKIVDFGLGQVLERDFSIVSPNYAAPELLNSKRIKHDRCDFWALGVVFYAILNGVLPFCGDDSESVLNLVLTQKIEPVKDIPEMANECVLGLLNRDASKRWGIKQLQASEYIVDQYKKPVEPNVSEIIDFRIVYTMISQVPEWNAVKVIKMLNGNKFNHVTATYYLLSERRDEKMKQWDFNEQKQFAQALGINLTEDGDIEIIED